MGYEASFRGDPITINPPLTGKAIDAWHADHPVGDNHAARLAGHFCSIRLDVTTEEKPLADDSGDVVVSRRAASFHIDGDDLREESVIKDVRDLDEHAHRNGSQVYGVLVQTDGHPDASYPVHWVIGNGQVEPHRPVLLYPLDPDGIGALARAVQRHTGQLNRTPNSWGSDEASSVATDMVRELYTALQKAER